MLLLEYSHNILMPYKRKRSYGRKRKFTRRVRRRRGGRRRRGNLNRMVNMGPRNFPNKCIINCTYAATNVFNPAAVVGHISFRGNSIYDCIGDGTNVTATPYNAIFGIWNRASVISSKITVHCKNESAATCDVYLFPYDFNATGVTDPQQWEENQLFRKRTMDGTTRGGPSWCTLSHSMSTKKLINISALEDRASAEIGTTPVINWFWLLGVRTISTSTTANITYQVRITYKTRLSSRFILQA